MVVNVSAADHLPQVREQPFQLAGQRPGRLGDDHEHRVAVLIGDPGLHGGRGGELQPGDVGLLDLPGAVVGAGMPVGVQEPERLGPGGGVPAGQRHHQLRRFPGGGELAELAADRLDLRRPVQAEHPAQRRGRHPGGALGPRLAGQGQEHQGQQRRGQAVIPVPQPPVDLAGAFEQAGVRQGGQRQQQPGQRIPRPLGEHRLGALAEQPPPGQRPLGAAGYRVRQHRQRLLTARCGIVPPGRRAPLAGAVTGVLAGRAWPAGRAFPAGTGRHPAERVPDAERRHPDRRRDLPQARPGRVQPGDPRDHLAGQLPRAFRAPPGRDEPGHAARGQRPVPPPDRRRVHPERRRDLALRRGPQPDQLHCGQPPPGLVPGVPPKRGQPVHRDQPAAVRARHQAHAGGDLLGPGEQQRQHRLGEHATHHPPHPAAHQLAIIISHIGHAGRERHARNADQPATGNQARVSMSGVLGTGPYDAIAGYGREPAACNREPSGRL